MPATGRLIAVDKALTNRIRMSKSNNATFHRPAGSRPIDAPCIVTDLEDRIQQLEAEEAWQKNDRNGITLFKTAGITVVLSTLREGAGITDNTAAGVMTVQVLDGRIEATVAGSSSKAGKGEVLFIHREEPHTIQVLEHSRLLITLTGDTGVD